MIIFVTGFASFIKKHKKYNPKRFKHYNMTKTFPSKSGNKTQDACARAVIGQ